MQILNGNQILVQSIINLGGTFFSGYPITPASTIMNEWVRSNKNNHNLKFIQSEDELSAINMAIGASLAGEISFTATSGPGMSLMQESIGWAFAIEAPIVIIDSMRRGPSTGMPTIGSQEDILQTNFGSHGDYEIPVFYPSSLENIPFYTYQAFVTAEKLRTPVILLIDGYLSGLQQNIEIKEVLKIPSVNKGLEPLSKKEKTRYFTGLTTNDDGDVRSYSIEDYKKWLDKRLQKIVPLKTNNYYQYIDNNSDTLVIGFGINEILCKALSKENVNVLIINQLFPVMDGVIDIINKSKNVFVCEINKGQYIFLLRSLIRNKELKFIEIEDVDVRVDNILRKINVG